MKRSLYVLGLIAMALPGCEQAAPPASPPAPQTAPKDQAGAAAPAALWSAEFKAQTLKECIQSATGDMNTAGARKCKCVVEKASTSIPEERFKTINTSPEVKALIKQIGATC